MVAYCDPSYQNSNEKSIEVYDSVIELTPRSLSLAWQGTIEEWHVVFCISAAFCAVGMVVYLLFASDEIQPWAKTGEEQPQLQKESLTAVEENSLLAVGDVRGEKA